MDKDFEKQIEYVGIPAWHEKGYKGKGITVFMDDVGGNHVVNTAEVVVKTILPEATVYTGGIEYEIKNDAVESCSIRCDETGESLPFDEFIKKYNVKLLNNSTDGGNRKDGPNAVYMAKKIREHNIIMTASAGNGTGRPINNKYYGAAIIVTGCRLQDDNPVSGRYAEDEGIDFSAFTAGMVGTSFAAPFLLGMIGLLVTRNPNLTQQQAIEYFAAHCEDLGKAGPDSIYGRGLALMGNPETTIKMWPGVKTMTVDGNDVELDQAPEIIRTTKRTLVPLRAISEALGCTVDWDAKTKTITIVR